jgi:hypothetical protein
MSEKCDLGDRGKKIGVEKEKLGNINDKGATP